MNSIYHFFKSLQNNKQDLVATGRLDDVPFDEGILSCRNAGVFPDMAIRVNKDKSRFTGGELIELKDSDSYTVSSFNSTIPSRSKEIAKIITGETSIIKDQMEESGDDIFSLPVRDVYYLIRGRKKKNTKVCLVYGSFFETIRIEDLISQSFSQVLEELLKESKEEISKELKARLLSIFSEQEIFSKVRTVEKASVKLRFRIMTEVKAEGNILNSKKYPQILDNTLNFVLPCHDDNVESKVRANLDIVFSEKQLQQFSIFKLKHHFNGYFLVVQTSI
jgi:mRNA-degrading endonuclease RelE of RelBE toxin-antitoxin system